MKVNAFKYANIGVAVAFVILAVGVVVLKDAGEGPQQLLGIGAFLAAMAVYLFLCERAIRRQERDQ